ncbi:MAG TPA: hypothetical protein VEP28_09020, partial [Rubrobacter sp.]|nr:hypothetical protein [Rubrobacter sp.]
DPLQRAPRHPSREPLRHVLLHHRGFWNPILDRTHFFERVERLIRRSVPGTDSRLRSEKEETLDG